MKSDMENKSIFDSLSPTKVFLSGLVVGVLVLCTVGFFVMLSIYLSGGSVFAQDDFADTQNNNGGTVVDNGSGDGNNVSIRAVDVKKDHIRGDKDAKISIVVYTDFECPFCKRFHETMLSVMDNFDDDVKWVFRHFPLDSLHRQARTEALASECASEQGKFWEYSDLIFERTTSNDGLDLNKLPVYAKELGLNVNQFTNCLDSQKYASRVDEDVIDGQGAGARGTPHSVIVGPNGEKVPVSGAQPYSSLETILNSML
jgi:protein-disulfide isomerase